MISFFVEGEPKGQPRGRAVIRGKGPKAHAGIYSPTKGPHIPWVNAVQISANTHRPSEPIQGPLHVNLDFYFSRPKCHFGTGRNAGEIKGSAPSAYIIKPDIDNLAKLILDALTRAGFWNDDTQVVTLNAKKSYKLRTAGCHVEIIAQLSV